jgi:hypothetical protein
MVQDATINNIVNWLRREIDRLHVIPSKLKKLGIDTSAAGWERTLGQAMFLLNVNGVDDRYGDGEARKFRQLDYRYRETESVPLVQILKSLQCWLYQCSEGNVPETELYTFFATDVQLYLMSKIIERLPEYQEAYWG